MRVFCGGTVRDELAQAACDRALRDELVRCGYRVIVIRYDRTIAESQHPEIFGAPAARRMA